MKRVALYIRRVREAITDLDLEVEAYPTPKDAVRCVLQNLNAIR